VSNVPDTPSAHKIKYDDSQQNLTGSPLLRRLSAFPGRSSSPDEEGNDQKGEDLWELNIWDPSKFSLFFMVAYSPLHAFIVWICPIGIYQIALLALLSGFLYVVVESFLTLIKDKSIVHSEVLGEYGKKMVRPVVAVARRDVAVGPDGNVEVYSPSPKGKFYTRDVRESKSRASLASSASTSPWASPIKNVGYKSPSKSNTSLRQQASLNSIGSRYNQRSSFVGDAKSPRPWHDYNESPLSKR
jgi:hypothetical protein